jgi:hypothetical protein
MRARQSITFANAKKRTALTNPGKAKSVYGLACSGLSYKKAAISRQLPIITSEPMIRKVLEIPGVSKESDFMLRCLA